MEKEIETKEKVGLENAKIRSTGPKKVNDSRLGMSLHVTQKLLHATKTSLHVEKKSLHVAKTR